MLSVMKAYMLIAALALTCLTEARVEKEKGKLDSKGTANHTKTVPVPQQLENDTVRPSDTCQYPKKLESSRLACEIFPSKIYCKHTCVYGHTFSEGTEREMSCIFSENIWKPYHSFEECTSTVDCSIRLLPGGMKHCVKNLVHSPPYCDIECRRFEDKPAVPNQRYFCNLKGEWSPELPFCAVPENANYHLLQYQNDYKK